MLRNQENPYLNQILCAYLAKLNLFGAGLRVARNLVSGDPLSVRRLAFANFATFLANQSLPFESEISRKIAHLSV